MRHLLVTNDFPPKIGGIQSYLWELWRRLPPETVTVLTGNDPDAREFDAVQPFRIERWRGKFLLPTRALRNRIDELAAEVGARIVLLDPVLPVGWLGPSLRNPYGLVTHGAEIAVPGRLPLARQAIARVARGASLVVAAGGYPKTELERAARQELPTTVVPPGVDVSRFRRYDEVERTAARARLGIDQGARLVVSVSRLVPRKGMDVLIEASGVLSRTRPDLSVVIAGTGRDQGRLEKAAARHRAPVRLLGAVGDDELRDLLGCADVFAMICRDRWSGLEQEGFGIVFLEAAAAGLPAVAGRSGGSHEAVVHGTTGLVVDQPRSVVRVGAALARLLDDAELARRMGDAARQRAEEHFTYEKLARGLHEAIEAVGSS